MVAVELLLRVAESSCLGLHKVGCTVGDGTPALSVVRGATKDGNYPTKGVGDGDREAEEQGKKGVERERTKENVHCKPINVPHAIYAGELTNFFLTVNMTTHAVFESVVVLCILLADPCGFRVGKCINVNTDLNGGTKGLITALQMKHFDAGFLSSPVPPHACVYGGVFSCSL
jgi:hypothetical protein